MYETDRPSTLVNDIRWLLHFGSWSLVRSAMPNNNNAVYGRINSRMTSYLKIFVLIDFHFQDAIFPFNRAAPYGMTSAVPREQGRTSARSAERPLALDPRPHSSAAARASLRFLVRSATERRTSRGEISFQLPFKRYPIKNFGEQPGGQIWKFSPRGCPQLPEIQNTS